MMRTNRKHYIPERDKKKIRKKIIKGAKLNTASERILFPAALCGDNLSELQKCASVGVQKWPITRKWNPVESLVNKGYKDLEFHSRCNFNPLQPECAERAYLIGPRRFVEKNEDSFSTLFDEEESHETSAKFVMRRMTATHAKFHEIPDGYTKQPVVLAKTWNVSFIPKKDSLDDDRKSPEFVKIKDITEEAMMEIYKHSDGFFVTDVNERRFVTKKNKRMSNVLKKEIARQSILKSPMVKISEEIETEKVPSPLLLTDILLSQYDSSVTEQKSADVSSSWDAPSISQASVGAKVPLSKPVLPWDTSHLDHRIRSSISMDETMTEIKYPKEKRTTEKKAPVPFSTIKEDAIVKQTTKDKKTVEPHAPETAIKPKQMKEIFSKDWEPPVIAPVPESKDLPKGLKNIIVAEDVKEEDLEDKRMAISKIKEKEPLVGPSMNLITSIKIGSSSEKGELKEMDGKATKKKAQFRPVTETNIEDQVMKLPLFEPPVKRKTDKEKVQGEAKTPEEQPTSRLAQAIEKGALKKKTPSKDESAQKKGPKSKAKEKQPEVVEVDKPPTMGKKDTPEFVRNVSTFEKDEIDRSSRTNISSAWSRKRAVNKLKSKKIVEEKRDEKKTLMSEIKGQTKSLRDSGDSDGKMNTSVASVLRQRDALTGIPEFDLPEVEPLDISQFGTEPPSFEERSKRLTKKAKKTKQGRMKEIASGMSSRTDQSFEEEIVANRLDNADKQKHAKDKKLAKELAHRLSKLELYKLAKDRGENEKKEKYTEDLVDYDKPLRALSESLEEEKKSPFQLGENIKYDTAEERMKKKASVKRELSKSRTLSRSETDNLEEGVQRVGDLDLLELSSDKKRRTSRRALDAKSQKLRFQEGRQFYNQRGKQRSSLRSKYGLYHTSYLTGEGKRGSVTQEGPDEAMYTFGRFPASTWASGHEMGAQPRFHFPIQLSVLDGLSPLEYLELYTSIPSRRLGVYQRIFNKHSVRKEIPMSVMKNALDDMVVGPFSKEDYLVIMSLVERNRAKAIPWNEFKLICCLTDRLMDDSTTASAVTPMTDYLQIADSNTVLNMLKEQTTNMPLTNLLNAVASCQLYY